MSHQHSKAPWIVILGDAKQSSEIWSADRKVIIADVCSHVFKTGNFADAHLIGAAPQLLALAERVARLNAASPTIGAGMLASLVDEAQAALARASGRLA